MSKSVIAFASLVVIQVSIGLIYKLAASEAGGYSFSKASALTMSEGFKLVLSIFLYHESKTSQTRDFIPFQKDGQKPIIDIRSMANEVPGFVRNGMIILAFLYLVNNHIFFYLVTLADPGTINLVKSASTFLSAGILWMFAGRIPSKLQWFAICFQTLGLVTSQYNECVGNSYEIMIYLLIFVNTIISACCGCFNDYLSKASSASLHALNFWLYSFGFLFNLSYYFILRQHNTSEPAFFDGYQGWGLMVVFSNSIIGIAITAVYKYGDAIVKCIAQSVSTSMLLVLSFMLFGAGLRVLTAIGCLIIFLATYLYMIPL